MARGSRIQCARVPPAREPPRNVGGSAIRISSGGGESIQVRAVREHVGRDALHPVLKQR